MKTVQITLSRAHKVAERLKALLSEQSAIALQCLSSSTINLVNTGASVGVSADQINALNTRYTDGAKAVSTYKQYNEAYGALRAVIGKANISAGVADLLTQQETMSRQVSMLTKLLEQENVNFVQVAQLAGYAPVATDRGYREPSVTVDLMTKDLRDTLKELLAEYKKRIYVVSDKVSDANATKITVEFDDDLAGVLGLV